MLDVYHASREELIRIIVAQRETLAEQAALLARQPQHRAEQQATNSELPQRVGELAANRQLEQRVHALAGRRDKPRGLAGNKLIPDKAAKPKRARKPRRHNLARAGWSRPRAYSMPSTPARTAGTR